MNIFRRIMCRLGYHAFKAYPRGFGSPVYYCDCGKRKGESAWSRKHG